mmetsp:Transcript_51615/g.121144  ORF Transcript_51615/g.121144 Transcript_51615/m.121144 type:complete len:238 (+) Transcript_51615:618-1331(+)
MHRFVDGLDFVGRGELVLVLDSRGRRKKRVVVEVSHVTEDDDACLAYRADMSFQHVVQFYVGCVQNLSDPNVVCLPVCWKLLERVHLPALRPTHQPPFHVPRLSLEHRVPALEIEDGCLNAVDDTHAEMLHASHEIVVPQSCLEGRGKGAFGGVAVAHALLSGFADVGCDERLGGVGVRVAHVMLIAKPAFHVGAVFLLPKVDFWCGANELQLDRSRDWFICQVRLVHSEFPSNDVD